MRTNLLSGIVSVFLVLTVIMGGCFYLLWSKVNPPDPQVESQHKLAVKENKKEEQRVLFPLESFVINLADDKEQKYLRMSIVMELTSEEARLEVSNSLSLIRDTVFKIVPQKKSKEIIPSSGRIALGEEIMDKLNLLLKNGSVINIFFTEYMIQ